MINQIKSPYDKSNKKSIKEIKTSYLFDLSNKFYKKHAKNNL